MTTAEPKDGTMLVLLALSQGEEVRPDGADLRLTLPNRPDGIFMPPDAFDDLEARGWVEVTETGAEPTERGRYWLDRWVRRKLGPGRVRLVSARIKAARPLEPSLFAEHKDDE